MNDTPDLSRPYCPGCEPDVDALVEILRIQWCPDHVLRCNGLDDDRVVSDRFLGYSGDAEGSDCRAAAHVLHRTARRG